MGTGASPTTFIVWRLHSITPRKDAAVRAADNVRMIDPAEAATTVEAAREPLERVQRREGEVLRGISLLNQPNVLQRLRFPCLQKSSST
jgi:hypothetical protein